MIITERRFVTGVNNGQTSVHRSCEVKFKMLIQLVLADEILPAKRTRVRFGSTVNTLNVALEVVGSGKVLATDVTAVRLGSRVDLQMALQVDVFCK